MSKTSPITVHLSPEDVAKVEREAEEAGWTAAMWIEWLIHDYTPPEEIGGGDE